jgi:hypothetical protein
VVEQHRSAPGIATPDRKARVTRPIVVSRQSSGRAMNGSKGLISLLDNDTGKAIAVTLWDSEEAMAASEADANAVREQPLRSTEPDPRRRALVRPVR